MRDWRAWDRCSDRDARAQQTNWNEGRDRSLSQLGNFDLRTKLGYKNLSYYLGAGLRGPGLHRCWQVYAARLGSNLHHVRQDCQEIRFRDPYRNHGLLDQSRTKPRHRVVGAHGFEGCGAPGAQAASRKLRVTVWRGSVMADPSRWEIRVVTKTHS